MPPHPSATRRIAAGMLAACAVSLLGCSPAPQPEPTPTPAFASEAEAFAAAEATYRAYNDADNARRAGSPSPDPRDFLLGAALEGDIDAMNYLQGQGLHVVGTTTIVSFVTEDVEIDGAAVDLNAVVCIDASETTVLDDSDTDVTPADRQDQLLMGIGMTSYKGELRIAKELSLGDSGC